MKIVSRDAEPGRAEVIRLDPDRKPTQSDRTNWGLMLVLFMRTVAGLWMFRGLLHWQTIIAPDMTPFEALPSAVAVCVVFFAVADIIAAVGMWLASAWGGVLWLFTTTASIIVTVAIPEFRAGGAIMLAIDASLIVVYFALTWFAAHVRED